MPDNLTCLEFRRRITTEPRAEDEDLLVHAEHCATCQNFRRDMLLQEQALERALAVPSPERLMAQIKLKQSMAQARDDDTLQDLELALRVPVPEGLTDRILQRSRFARRRAARRTAFGQFAVAASVAVAVLVGTLMMLRPPALESEDVHLVNAVFDHTSYHTLPGRHEVPAELVAPVAHMVGLEFSKPLRHRVTAVTACDIQNKGALHLVLRGREGPINAYVMPGHHVAHAGAEDRDSMRAFLLPVRHGSIAVIGDPKEDLDSYANSLKETLRWRM